LKAEAEKPKLIPIGTRNGDWILKKRVKLGNGKYRDVWILDPTAVITPSKAYEYAKDNDASSIASPEPATTEFTSTKYSAIASDDAVYADTSASADTAKYYANAAQKFVFDLTNYNTGGKVVTGLTYRWDGYKKDFGDYTTTVYIMHKETSGWVQDGTAPTSDGAGFELTVAITNVGAAIINNQFTFGLYGSGTVVTGAYREFHIYTDYVELQVDYALYLDDEGVGEDALGVTVETLIEDSGAGTDEFGLSYKEVLAEDEGTCVDTLSVVTPVDLSDAGAGEDSFEAAVLYFEKVFEDEGVGADSFESTVTRVELTLDDEGFALDELSLPYKEVWFEDEAAATDEFAGKDVTFALLTEKMNSLLQFVFQMMPLMVMVAMVKAVRGIAKPKVKAEKKLAELPKGLPPRK